jgi:hypothetical protein
MTEPTKGVFMPLHKTQTDPTEPDWDTKDDFVDDLGSEPIKVLVMASFH